MFALQGCVKNKEADLLANLFSGLLKWQTLVKTITSSSCVCSYEDASCACESPFYASYASFRLA